MEMIGVSQSGRIVPWGGVDNHIQLAPQTCPEEKPLLAASRGFLSTT